MPNAYAPTYDASLDQDADFGDKSHASKKSLLVASFDALLEAKTEQGLLDFLADELSSGRSILSIAKSKGVRACDIKAWLNADQSRANFVSSALELYADDLVAETIGISDDDGDNVARDRLRVDTRWRLAEKLDKARFGNHDNKALGNITIVLANPLDVGTIINHAASVPEDGVLISTANSVPAIDDAGGGLSDPTLTRVP